MVRRREKTQTYSTSHAVTTMRLRLPAGAATMRVMIVKVAPRKEAAP